MRQLRLSLLLGLLLPLASQAQSVRFQSQAISTRGAGIANATVAVCTQPANTNTQPCSPLATLATSTSTTSGGANPLTADSFGNFFFYAAPGRYTVQIYGPAVSGQFVTPDVEVPTAGASAAVTSVFQCKNLQTIQCVSGTNTVSDQGWAGADVGGWINSAYAALPSTGGQIWVFPKADGTCYTDATQVNFTTSGKPVMLKGVGGTKADPLGGGTCINYTVTAAGTMILWDTAVASRSFWPGADGAEDITFINNNCVTSGGCGSTSNGIQTGLTNWGLLNAVFNRVSMAGFSSGYVFSNQNSANINLNDNIFTGNGIAVDFGHVNGIHVKSGLWNGNGSAFKAETAVGGELEIIGGNFVVPVNDFVNCTNATTSCDVYVTSSHFETSTGCGNSHIFTGNMDLTISGGLIEDDCTSGNSDYFISISSGAHFLEIYGTLFSSPGRTLTNPITVASPVRSKIFASVITPSILPVTSFVGGTGAANATFFISNGTSGNTQSLNQMEGAFKTPLGVGDVAFVPTVGVGLDLHQNAANDFVKFLDTTQGFGEWRMGPGTGGARFSLRDQTNAKQIWNINSGASGGSLTLPTACAFTTLQGAGSPALVCAATSQKTESAADANVLTFTPPAAVGTYRLHLDGSISAATAATLGWTATWTDSNGNAATPTNLSVCLASTGVCAATTGALSAVDRFSGTYLIDVNNAATAIVIKLTFSGTSFTAKVSATVERII